MQEIISFEELLEAYIDCRQRKRSTKEAVEFELDLPVELYKLWKELNNNMYQIGPSVVFLLTEPCYREVFAAKFRDRIVHHLLMHRIKQLFEDEFVDNTFSCRDGRGVLVGIQTCQKHMEEAYGEFGPGAVIVKCDIKSFFTSIDKKILENKLEKLILKSNLQDRSFLIKIVNLIIDNCPQFNYICKQPRKLWDNLPKHKSLFSIPPQMGMAIGNLTSQWFANYYLNDLDHMISNTTKYYGRYVDDFYFIVPNLKTAKDILEKIKILLNEEGLKLNDQKTHIQPLNHGIRFIGANLNKDKRFVIRRTIAGFYKTIKHFSIYTKTHKINKNDLYYILSSLNSYLGYLRSFNSYKLRKKIVDHLPNTLKYYFSHQNYERFIINVKK